MKNLLFLLFPFMLQAQSVLPDTIIVKNNKVYPCIITGLNEKKVDFDYPGWGKSMLVLDAVDRIILSENGTVYTSAQGFTKNPDEIYLYVKNREDQRALEEKQRQKQQKLLLEKQNKESVSTLAATGENKLAVTSSVDENQTFQPGEKQWSFGVLLIPYYSGRIYSYLRNSDGSTGNVLTSVNNEINMEGQFAYKLSRNFSLTFDVSYTSAFTDNQYESHNRPAEPYNSGYDQGYQQSNDLKLVDLSIGAKYYLTHYEEDYVNAYFLAGIGKQFAIADISYKELYPQEPLPYIYEDNEEEYIEEMNSPWSFNLGFGAEYMFNKSLSVYSVIRFYYSKINAEYKTRQITTSSIQSVSSEYTKSDFITRIGVGLNFYF